MKENIALLPFFICAFYMLFRSPEKAFINVYLPCLIFFPLYANTSFIGLPDFSFSQSAIVPIFAVVTFKKLGTFSTKWLKFPRFDLVDLLLLGFIFVVVYSEYRSTGHREDLFDGGLWKSVLYKLVTYNLVPYLLAKELIYPKGMSVEFSKKLIVLLSIVIAISVVEWRFVVNPFVQFVEKFFPEKAAITIWVPAYRLGFTRISGSFFHPILCGTIIGLGLLLNHWLKRNQNPVSHLVNSILLVDVFTVILALGLLMTLSRGPLLSYSLAAIFIGVGYSRSRRTSFFIRLLILFVVGLCSIQLYYYYKEMNMRLTESGLVASAAYRTQLIENYLFYISKKPYWGWGSHTIPAVIGQKSVDNHFLWLTIKHGYIALTLFISMIVVALIELFCRGFALNRVYKSDISLSFTLFSGIILISSSIMMVYLGSQLEPLFFILLGWSVGFLKQTRKKAHSGAPKKEPSMQRLLTS